MPADPLVTIGIPTYNRPHFLRESLASALAQTYPNIEVVVSDNSPDDAAERVVAGFADHRVRYHRNPTNIGSRPNFLRLLDLARGDYFAWLQDDDLLACGFVAGGVGELQARPDVPVYLAYAANTARPGTLCDAGLIGPPFATDWVGGRVRVVAGGVVGPLSLLTTVGMPPTALFRAGPLRTHIGHFADPEFPLFTERTLLTAVTQGAGVAVAPVVGGVFRSHPDQDYRRLWGDYQRQWAALARALSALLPADAARTSGDLLGETLHAVPPDTLQRWQAQVATWAVSTPLVDDVRAAVQAAAGPPAPHSGLGRTLARRLLPPVVADGLRWAGRRVGG